MDITAISDLHGHYPQLEGGDLLIVAGDIGARDVREEYVQFFKWLILQKYRKIILIAGNHDNWLTQLYRIPDEETNLEYLCDSGTEYEGLKIWGSPWTKRFDGENPRALAFTCETEEELAEKCRCIPEDTDILVTHSPMWGIYDSLTSGKHVGSLGLCVKCNKLKKLKLHVCGHIHEAYGYGPCELRMGVEYPLKEFIGINASIVNERYEPVNNPIRIEL